MKIKELAKYLPIEIVKYIISFDSSIVIRREKLYFIKNINKELYEESYKVLLKKPIIKESRTTTFNNQKETYATIRLKNPDIAIYISYSSKKNEYKFSFDLWSKNGIYRKYEYLMPL